MNRFGSEQYGTEFQPLFSVLSGETQVVHYRVVRSGSWASGLVSELLSPTLRHKISAAHTTKKLKAL